MKVLRESGYTYLGTKYRRNKNVGMILSLMGILPVILGFYLTNWIAVLFGVLLVSIGVGYLASARNYKAGIEGEEAVVEALQELDDSYYLINDIMLGTKTGNIDHVLLCPKGIFAIETKNYTGDVRCDGDRWRKKGSRRLYDIPSVSKQAIINAHYLSGLIRRRLNMAIFVSPICVFTNRYVELKVRKPTIPVLRLVELVRFIEEIQPPTKLTDNEIQAISQCILRAYRGEAENTRQS